MESLFTLTGGKKYNVVSQIKIIPEFYNGFEWESKLVETLSDFYVNGVAGRGITEFCYRFVLFTSARQFPLLRKQRTPHIDYRPLLTGTVTISDYLRIVQSQRRNYSKNQNCSIL